MRNKAGAWFNGVDSYVSIPQGVIDGTSDYTVVVELNDIAEKSPFSGILRHGFDIYIYKLAGYLRGEVLQADGVWKATSAHYENGIALWRKSGMLLEMFLNGVKVSEALLTDTPKISSERYVGKTTNTTVSKGVIQRVLFYKRALRDDEIDALYQKNVIPSHPSLYYDFRLGHTLDLSGNGNHGIPYNVQFIGTYIKKGLWLPGQSDAYVEIPEAVINGDDDYTVAVEFADIQPGKLFQHGNDLIIELEGKTLKAYRIDSASEQETVTYNLSQFSGMAIVRKAGNNLELLWNGASVGSVAVTGDVLPGTEWQIGNALRGNIKRVIAYQGALDDVEINQLLNRQLPPHPSPSLYYDFRLGHTNDLSGHGRDGILHGGLLWI